VQALSAGDVFLFEGFRLEQRGLFREEHDAVLGPVEIGSRALDVLRVLLERPGDLVSRDEIMTAAWPGTVVDYNNLNVQISTLRRALDQDRASGSCIQTVPGRGYRFVAPVTCVGSAAPSISASPPDNDISVAEDEPPELWIRSSLGVTPLVPILRARGRFWGGVIAAAVGVLVLVAVMAAGIWRLPWSGDAPGAAVFDCRAAFCQPQW
jgi:DNA-binding winged helix-turn-helix (wHTH) protein